MTFFDSQVSKLYAAEFDLSSFTTSLAPSMPRNLSDVATFGDAGVKHHPSLEEAKYALEGIHQGGNADEFLNDLKVAGATGLTVSYFPEGDAIGVDGYSAGASLYVSHEKQTRVGNVVLFSAEIDFNGVVLRSKSMGTAPVAAIIATTAGTEIDDGASSASGGTFIYHVLTLTAVGGNAQWKLHLEHDDNTPNFPSSADKVTVTIAHATGPTSGVSAFTGTLERYVRQRFELDAVSGTLIAFVAYVRN